VEDLTTCCHVISVLSAVDQSVSVSTWPIHSPPASTCSAPSKFYWHVINHWHIYGSWFCD